MTAPSTPVHRPTIPGSVLAVAAAAVAVAVVADTPTQWRALGLEIAGLACVAVGYVAWRRESLIGVVAGLLAGASLVAAGFGLAITGPVTIVHRLELLPGMVGLVVLLAGLLPVRVGRERTLVVVGTALVFVGVATSGVVRGATLFRLLVAGIATVVAWDLGEQAISLGRQVGRDADTYRVELVHLGGTAVAGTGVLVATLVVYRMDVTGLSLAGLAVLLVAGVVLTVALRH